MPKPFMIGVEIEEVAFGAVMRKIDALPGVVKIHLNLNKDKNGPAAKPNGTGNTRGSFDTTGKEALGALLFKTSPLTASQLKQAFVAEGRSPASISSVLHSMKTDGDIKLTDQGYVLSKKMRDRLRHRKGTK